MFAVAKEGFQGSFIDKYIRKRKEGLGGNVKNSASGILNLTFFPAINPS